jgi:Leucine Rich repeat
VSADCGLQRPRFIATKPLTGRATLYLCLVFRKNQPALLVNIDLGRNCLSAEMGVLLAATLPCLTRLESLSLDYNMLGDVGITAIASAVMSHKTLRTLRVRCNQIGEPGFDTLVQAVLASKTLGTLELCVPVGFRWLQFMGGVDFQFHVQRCATPTICASPLGQCKVVDFADGFKFRHDRTSLRRVAVDASP